MKYLKNFIKVLVWPILLWIGQFLIQYIFIYAFNLDKTKLLKKLNPELNNNEINDLLIELIKTNDYKNELNNYINSKSLLIIFLVFIILIPIFYKVFKKYKTNNKIKKENIIIIILLGISISLIYNVCMFNLNNIVNFTNQFKLNNINIFVQILGSGIIGPILEELVFRGIVYNKLKSFNKPITSIIITSIIFSIMHTSLLNIPYAFILSLVLIYIYEKNKTLKAPILLHISANTIIILLMPIILNNILILNYSILFISIIVLLLIYLKIIKKDVY